MDQDISFCTTSDGVTIAYATLGEGPPLVYVTGWPGHLQLEFDTEHSRELIRALSEGVRLVRYDMRGSGLSDTDVSDLTLDRFVLDLAAVIDEVGPPVNLLSLGFLAGPIAITYAAQSPERVASLILSSGYLRGADLADEERGRALVAFIRTSGFPMDISTIEEGTEKQFRGVAQIQKESAPKEVQAQVAEAMLGADVTELAAKVAMPTLVIHGRQDTAIPFSNGRKLASTLPNAKFVPFEGTSSAPWQYQDVIVGEIKSFLGVSVETKRTTATGDVRTVLFTDIVGHTEMMSRLGDAAGRDVLREHEKITRDTLAAHAGTEVKTIGDGFMASFGSVTKAVECAIALQVAFSERESDEPLSVRVGINAGEPIEEDGDLFGATVILASRIAAKAEGAEILVADTVRGLCSGKGFLFADRGEFVAKGFEVPVRLYEVSWRSS